MKLLDLIEQMTTAIGGATMQTGSGEQFTGKKAFKKKATLKEKKPIKKPIQTMNIQELYNQVTSEQISKAAFLESVRRNPLCKGFITNVSSFEDTLQQLKSRGYIYEAKKEMKEDFNFNASVQQFTEAAKKVTRDDVNDYEFQKGWRYEYEKMKTPDVKKAQDKALKHLASDDIYYTRLITQEKKTGRTDQLIPVKKDNFVDKANEMKKAKKAKEYKADPKGKSEKVTGKPTGVKTMKGGDGEMKTIGEGVVKKKFNLKEAVSPAGTKPVALDTDVILQKLEKDYGPTSDIVKAADKIIGLYAGEKSDKQKGHAFLATEKQKSFLIALLKKYGVYDEYKKFLDVSVNENKPPQQPAKKDVIFTVEDSVDKGKEQLEKTIASIKKGKDGKYVVLFTTKERVEVAKEGDNITGQYFGDTSHPVTSEDVIDLGTMEPIVKKLFPAEEEEQEERNKIAQANKNNTGTFSANEADQQLEETLRKLICEKIKATLH